MIYPVLIALLFVFMPLSDQKGAAKTPPPPTVNANCGSCSAEFHVIQTSSDPVADAVISVSIPSKSEKRRAMKLELRTDVNGRALFRGLSDRATPLLHFAVHFGRGTTTVDVDLRECHGTYDVVLPDRPPEPER
jgi:hypothetical protein